MNPSLKPENRKEFIQQAMKAMSDRQEEVIAQADKIIGDVVRFEENIHRKFVSYITNH